MSWRTVNLGELVENFSVRAKDHDSVTSELEFFGVSNEDGITKSKNAAKHKAKEYKIIEKNCFAYNPYRINVGSIGLLEDDVVGLISPAYVVFKPKPRSIIPQLLLKFLRSTEGLRQIKLYARGTVRQALRFEDLCKIEMAIPDYEEQLDFFKRIEETEIESKEISTELTHQLDLVKQVRQAFLREAMQGKLLKSSPTLNEEYPKEEVVAKNINNLPYLKTFRRKLRNNSTAAEAKLWSALKGKQLEGRKFRRQFSVANYILDFYCPAENLAIELDGQGHFEASQVEYDYERDQFLIHCGIKVLRFENKWVWNNLEGLLEEVKSNFGWKENNPSVLRTAPLEGEQQIEDARQLLAKIKAEKERLIKEKNPSTGLRARIKKQKPLPPITEEEIPFEIPENWVWCRLGEITLYSEGGKSLKGQDVPCDKNGWGVIKTSAITRGEFLELENKTFSNTTNQYQNIKINKGDLLFCRASGSKGLAGKSCVVRTNPYSNLILSDKSIRYILSKLVSVDYVNCFNASEFGSAYYLGLGTKKSTTMNNITRSQFDNLLIPLPPLSEQKRIVAKLDELMAYCDELEASIKASQQENELLLQQVLREALEPEKDLSIDQARP